MAGAVEGALRGVPAIAISLERRRPQDFSHAADFARALAAELIRRGPEALPDASLLSVNVPAGPVRGYRVTFLGRRVYRDQVEVRAGPARAARTTGSADPRSRRPTSPARICTPYAPGSRR